ncbi:MAG TPA: alpha/beta hydrolase [Hyphomicrobiales bacterium]|nr:alpha/beta hydrolase [Hyphomicrobiales bacterium]
MATYVIVHGAWGGSAGWTPTAERLRAAGHAVYTPTLTGLGQRKHLFSGAINLSTHVQDVAGVIESENLRDFVLVGHSYGGMVITGVADRFADRIRQLVYLDAFLPDDGTSAFDFIGREGTLHNIAGAGAHGGGVGVPPPDLSVFNVPSAQRALMQSTLSPQPIGTLIEKLKLTGAADRIPKRLYVWCSGYSPSIFTKAYERVKNDPKWQTEVMACGHVMMVDMPDRTFEILAGVA